jgi:adenylate cyclase
VEIAVSIHAGPAVVGEVGSSDPPAVIAIGEAVDGANELRKAAATHRKPFAISQSLYAAAGIEPAPQDRVLLQSARPTPIAAYLTASAPALPSSSRPDGERRTALQRLWTQ